MSAESMRGGLQNHWLYRRWKERRFASWSPSLRFGLSVVSIFIVATILSVFWTPYPPMAVDIGPVLSPPSAQHLFGTDNLGSDVFSRVLGATGLDVGITVAVVALALVVGSIWGALAGFYGRWFDTVTMRTLEMINAFPALLLAMLVIAIAGPSVANVIFVIALLPLPDYVRIARAEIMSKKSWPFADAARMMGRRPLGVLFRHLFPNSLRPLLIYASINASFVVATVGALGFVGLGIQPGSAEWGSMIAAGQGSITTGQWWVTFFPGAAILLLGVAFHLVGDGLADLDRQR